MTRLRSLLAAAVLLTPAPCVRAADPIRGMILDGQNAGPCHAWRLTTPVLRKVLEETGLFRVEVGTASYGKGRIFHTMLGHDIPALSCVGFVATFQRGAEWAATGRVTQPVPAAFPTRTTVSYRVDLAAMDPAGPR